MKLDLTPIDQWGLFPQGKRPLVVSGPCSAENEEMVMATAATLKNCGVNVYRAGVWKPRTHPGSFEGPGEAGLPWLARVKEELGMPVATEVASAHHIGLALKYGVDLFWIGARTTVNPFAVQEIADALRGTDVPVLIKNPINPEIELWMGAVERLYMAGVRKIALVHRGFSSYSKNQYRYAPYWQIPVEMKGNIPDIPMFCDPSHISGDRKYINELCEMAINLGFEGLMIEVHNSPDKALSDASQQITPDMLRKILEHLSLRKENIDSSEVRSRLDDLRGQIDTLDSELIDILAARMDIVEKISELKKAQNITILQLNRWNSVLEMAIKQAESKGLDRDYIEKIFRIIHIASINRQS